jgi:DNA-binding IclR family transcriptional regulator
MAGVNLIRQGRIMQKAINRHGPRHRVPVIDRMVEILDVLAHRGDGLSISDLVGAVGVPRTTVYRILNTLQDHGLIRRATSGNYSLGPRLLHLASQVSGGDPGYDLAAIATPHLERLSVTLGEAAKLSVVEDGLVLVLAAVQDKRAYALAVKSGERMPLHVGAAGKVLLAHLAEDLAAAALSRDAARFTPATIADRKQLADELVRIRRQGWAEDKGEFIPGIQAFAAPVIQQSGGTVGAVSVPYLAGASPERQAEILKAVIAAARDISGAIPVVAGFSAQASTAAGASRQP